MITGHTMGLVLLLLLILGHALFGWWTDALRFAPRRDLQTSRPEQCFPPRR